MVAQGTLYKRVLRGQKGSQRLDRPTPRYGRLDTWDSSRDLTPDEEASLDDYVDNLVSQAIEDTREETE